MLTKKYDFVVVGSGLAGLYASHYASQFGKVALLTKSAIDICNSYMAQGGVAAVFDADDTFESHYNDTMKAGRFLCDEEPLKILVEEGPQRIQELIDLGMSFDSVDGKIQLALEGGHSHRRVLHAGGDATGKEISLFLIKKIKQNNQIDVFENTILTEFITKDKECKGVYSYNIETKETFAFLSNRTILASGGASAVYARTTNPDSTVGDGFAIAYNAGCKLSDMEFIQFHPTSFFSENGYTFLISEAVRGEGAYLYNVNGERFMLNEHELAELAPRDVVSKAIYKQLLETHTPYVYLGLEHLEAERIKNRFPTIYKYCADQGEDLTKKVRIAPAAHYTVGGIKSGIHGETNLKGLFVCGEVASTGVMGANRLASNSLLECLVFGKRAIDQSLHIADSNFIPTPKEYYTNFNKEKAYIKCKIRISNLMTKYVGIVRNNKDLNAVLKKIEVEEAKFKFEENEYYSFKLTNLITVCKLIANSAIERKESRGGHIRTDFDKENKEYLHHIIQQKDKDFTYIKINNFVEIKE